MDAMTLKQKNEHYRKRKLAADRATMATEAGLTPEQVKARIDAEHTASMIDGRQEHDDVPAYLCRSNKDHAAWSRLKFDVDPAWTETRGHLKGVGGTKIYRVSHGHVTAPRAEY